MTSYTNVRPTKSLYSPKGFVRTNPLERGKTEPQVYVQTRVKGIFDNDEQNGEQH
uniref:Uncharacterized protein n=1 Tax=Arion vulgaris TaxID=1028688 RepID=A0A0B6Y173_9EUPU